MNAKQRQMLREGLSSLSSKTLIAADEASRLASKTPDTDTAKQLVQIREALYAKYLEVNRLYEKVISTK